MAIEALAATVKLTESRIVSQPSASRTRLVSLSTIIAAMKLQLIQFGVRIGFLLAIALGGATTLALSSFAHAANDTSKPAPLRTILVLGDSLSAEYGLRRGSGWVALLAAKLDGGNAGYAIVNASISGETTAGGRGRIEELLVKHQPAVLIVELGANDALRGLDLAVTEANLRSIVKAASHAKAKAVLVGMLVPPNYGKTYSQQFQAMFSRVAQTESAALVPFLLDGVADRIDNFQADRIHPNEAAQSRMLDNVWPALGPLLAARKR
jgi:acyl-CoA thioesterase I